jgi:hypothetical protein
MVDAITLASKPKGPSTPPRRFNQNVLPPVIDTVARAEAVLERIAQRSRRAPLTALGIAFGIGVLASALRRSRDPA